MANQKGMKRHEVVEGLTQEQEGKKKIRNMKQKGESLKYNYIEFLFPLAKTDLCNIQWNPHM